MRHKRRFINVLQGIFLLILVTGFSSCKNQKKMTDVSDQEDTAEQIQEEIAEMTPDEDEMVENPEKRVAVYEPTRSERLDDYFSSIANAPTTSAANREIQNALQMFSGGDAPVLVIFYRSNGQEDYDEPTTIERYLNYLKDTKNNDANVEEMVMDDNGRIKELVLKKK